MAPLSAARKFSNHYAAAAAAVAPNAPPFWKLHQKKKPTEIAATAQSKEMRCEAMMCYCRARSALFNINNNKKCVFIYIHETHTMINNDLYFPLLLLLRLLDL